MQRSTSDNLEVLYAIWDKWLYLPEKTPIDVLLATKLALHLKGDPVWMQIIGASGSGKSEMIRSIDGEDTYLTNKITAASLISGYKEDEPKRRGRKKKEEEENTDLLPKLNGKVLLIPDLSNILAYQDSNRQAVFTALQDCYDGSFVADFGTVGHREAKARFGFITGTTQVVDAVATRDSAFGQRFLRIQLHYEPEDVMEAIAKASQTAGKEPQMREELKAIMAATYKTAKAKIAGYNDIPVEPQVSVRMEALSSTVALLRSGVLSDARTGHINYLPRGEMGMRAQKQLINLGRCLACLYNHATVGDTEYEVMARIARDCVPDLRLKACQNLLDWQAVHQVAYAMHLQPTSLYRTIDDLYTLGIIEKDDAPSPLYRINPYYLEVFQAANVIQASIPSEYPPNRNAGKK